MGRGPPPRRPNTAHRASTSPLWRYSGASHPHSQAPSHQRYISASPSPEKTGKVLPSSSVNTSKWSLTLFVISHQGEPGGLTAHPCAFSYNTSDPSLPIRRQAPWCMGTSCPVSVHG